MSDPYWSNVVLAMHMDGVNNSTTFTDLKGKTVTPVGNAKISTTQSKFGGASAYFDGNGDYLSIPHSADFDLSSGDFTIETWLNCQTNNSDYMSIYSKRASVSVNSPIGIFIAPNRYLYVAIINNSNSTILNYLHNTQFNIGEFYHIAVVRNSNSFKIFINGVQVYSNTSSATLLYNTNNVEIGGQSVTNEYLRWFNGYLDDLRITKGVARYTSNFTPPTQAFPDSDVTTNSSSMFLVF